jgi:hypothetical protein
MANNLIIPSLAMLGLKRATPPSIPDLVTIYKTPYPVLTNYRKLMNDLQLEPFGGGTHIHQGPMQEGYLTSGYRDDATLSPHGFALALDIVIGNILQQIKAGKIALAYFNRVGLYPENGIIHVDLFTHELIEYYHKKKFWVRIDGVYTSFDSFSDAGEFAIEAVR